MLLRVVNHRLEQQHKEVMVIALALFDELVQVLSRARGGHLNDHGTVGAHTEFRDVFLRDGDQCLPVAKLDGRRPILRMEQEITTAVLVNMIVPQYYF